MIKIIAEIGCNHNGSKELARKMVAKQKSVGQMQSNSKHSVQMR